MFVFDRWPCYPQDSAESFIVHRGKPFYLLVLLAPPAKRRVGIAENDNLKTHPKRVAIYSFR